MTGLATLVRHDRAICDVRRMLAARRHCLVTAAAVHNRRIPDRRVVDRVRPRGARTITVAVKVVTGIGGKGVGAAPGCAVDYHLLGAVGMRRLTVTGATLEHVVAGVIDLGRHSAIAKAAGVVVHRMAGRQGLVGSMAVTTVDRTTPLRRAAAMAVGGRTGVGSIVPVTGESVDAVEHHVHLVVDMHGRIGAVKAGTDS